MSSTLAYREGDSFAVPLKEAGYGLGLAARIGGRGTVIEGSWPVIGPLPGWRREDWPAPAFGRHEELSGRFIRVEYPDGDPGGCPREHEIPREEVRETAEDGLAGHGFVETRLTRLLG